MEAEIITTNGTGAIKIAKGKGLQPNRRYAMILIPEDCPDTDARLSVSSPSTLDGGKIRQSVQLVFVTGKNNEVHPVVEDSSIESAKVPVKKPAKGKVKGGTK